MGSYMKRIGILVLYDQEGKYDNYIFYLIKELQAVVERLVVVCNGLVEEQSLERLQQCVVEVLVRENEGYDAGAYRHVLLEYLDKNELQQYDEVIFCNDSFYGPFISLYDMLEEMNNKKCDFWGIECITRGIISSYIGSYFLVFRNRIIQEKVLEEFFGRVLPVRLDTLKEAILYYEEGIFKYLLQLGYQYDLLLGHVDYNILFYNPYGAIVKEKYPILKKKSFSEKFLREDNMLHTLKKIRDDYPYDWNMIRENVERCHEITLWLKNEEGEFYLPTPFFSYEDERKEHPNFVSEAESKLFLSNIKQVYIYGAGAWGEKVAHDWYFNQLLHEYEVQFMGFMVSNKELTETNPNIYTIDEVEITEEIGIMVALEWKTAQEVKPLLEKYKNVIYLLKIREGAKE